MDQRFIHYYEQELKHVRETAREFAKEFPKIAGRLGLESLEVADPYVERLIESFAFLTARTQLKIDAHFPDFTQQLLQVLYPNFQAQTPSTLIAQFVPDVQEPGLKTGYLIPRHSRIKSHMVARGDPICEYRTSQDMTLWPISLNDANYMMTPSLIESDGWSLSNDSLTNSQSNIQTKAAIKLNFSSLAGLKFNEISIDELPIYIDGIDDFPFAIYEAIFSSGNGFILRAKDDPETAMHFNKECIQSVGFEDDQALLPMTKRNLNSYRLLQEYFVLPQKFLMFKLNQLQRYLPHCDSDQLELLIILDKPAKKLHQQINQNNFLLYCSAAINLIEKSIDRINLSPFEHEYEVIADKTKPLNYEIYSIEEVVGYNASNNNTMSFQPLYGQYDHPMDNQSEGFYSLRQEPRLLSKRQQKQGHRSSYIGSTTYISLTTDTDLIDSGKIKQLGMRALCTNRDLPLLMSLGKGPTDFTIDVGAPLEKIISISVPTKPLPVLSADKTNWLLIGLLGLNMQSLIGPDIANTLVQTSGGSQHRQDAVALRELLRLMGNCYGDQVQPQIETQIAALVFMSVKPTVRQIILNGHITIARGLHISLLCNESGFEGRSAFLLGTVLSYFFSRYVSINTFTEFELHSQQRGVIHRWPSRIGDKQLL